MIGKAGSKNTESSQKDTYSPRADSHRDFSSLPGILSPKSSLPMIMTPSGMSPLPVD
jgi:hypothetical protein